MEREGVFDVINCVIIYVLEMDQVLLYLMVFWILHFGEFCLEIRIFLDFFLLLKNSFICYQNVWFSKKLGLNLYFRRLEVFVASLVYRMEITLICSVKCLHWISALQS